MADKSIGTLPVIETLADDASFVAEQQGVAGRVTGSQIKDFAKEGADTYVTAAQAAAQEALAASQQAMNAVEMVGSAADEAEAAKVAAQAAAASQEAAELAQTAAEAARDQASAIAGGNFLPLAGGTMTGPLLLSGAPLEDNGAANKKYVDDAVGSSAIMQKSAYDATGAVAAAGGIAAYVGANSQAEPEVYLTKVTYENSAYTTDHTYAEIYAAHTAGKLCIAVYAGRGLYLRYADAGYVLFASAGNEENLAVTLKVTSADAVTYGSKTYLTTGDLSSSYSSDSTTVPANSYAVKQAYDKAASAQSAASSAQTAASNAQTAANGKASVTSGTPSVSAYSGSPTPTMVYGLWSRCGDIVTVQLRLNFGSVTYADFYDFYISDIPTSAQANIYMTGAGFSAAGATVVCYIDNNRHVTVLGTGAFTDNGFNTLHLTFSYIAA